MSEISSIYKRLEEFDIQWVLHHFLEKNINTIIEVNGIEYLVRSGSPQYILFKTKGLKCVRCGCRANKCFLETTFQQNNFANFHFYRIKEGKPELLFTIDHIIPKALGGKNEISNYQTMCHFCNKKKGSKIL